MSMNIDKELEKIAISSSFQDGELIKIFVDVKELKSLMKDWALEMVGEDEKS